MDKKKFDNLIEWFTVKTASDSWWIKDTSTYYIDEFIKQERKKTDEEKILDFLTEVLEKVGKDEVNDRYHLHASDLNEIAYYIMHDNLKLNISTFNKIYKRFSCNMNLDKSEQANKTLMSLLKYTNCKTFEFVPSILDLKFYEMVLLYYIENLTYNDLVRMTDTRVENLLDVLINTVSLKIADLREKIVGILKDNEPSKRLLARFRCFFDINILEMYLNRVNTSSNQLSVFDIFSIINSAHNRNGSVIECVNNFYDKFYNTNNRNLICRLYTYCDDTIRTLDDDEFYKTIKNIINSNETVFRGVVLGDTTICTRTFKNKEMRDIIPNSFIKGQELSTMLKLVDFKAVDYPEFLKFAKEFDVEIVNNQDLFGYALEQLAGVTAADIDNFVKIIMNKNMSDLLRTHNLNVEIEDFEFDIHLKDPDTIDLKLELLK